MNDAAVPYRIGLLEDLADPEEAAAYPDSALEDGDQQVIRLALQDVIEARKTRLMRIRVPTCRMQGFTNGL